MKFIINTKIFFLVLPLLFLIPFSLFSKGSLEREQAYRDEIQNSFTRTVQAVEAGDMSGREAKSVLAQVRRKYNRSYTDFSGMLDSLIDDVEEGRIGSEEAVLLYGEREQQRQSVQTGVSSSPKREEQERGESRPDSGSEPGSGGGNSSHESGQKGSTGKK